MQSLELITELLTFGSSFELTAVCILYGIIQQVSLFSHSVGNAFSPKYPATCKKENITHSEDVFVLTISLL